MRDILENVVFPEIAKSLERIFQRIFSISPTRIVITLQRKVECEEIPDEPWFRRIPGEFDRKRNEILLHLGAMSLDSFEKDFIETFVHESIHALQWNEGPTTIGGIKIQCDKGVMETTSHLSYDLRSHEVEAFKRTKPLIDYIKRRFPDAYSELLEIANTLKALVYGITLKISSLDSLTNAFLKDVLEAYLKLKRKIRFII